MKKQLTQTPRLTTAQRMETHADCPMCRGSMVDPYGNRCQYWGGGGLDKSVDPVEVTPAPSRGAFRHSEL